MKNTITLHHDGTEYLVENGAVVTTLAWYGRLYDGKPHHFLRFAKRKRVAVLITPEAQAAMEAGLP